jgi:hypothetical protein
MEDKNINLLEKINKVLKIYYEKNLLFYNYNMFFIEWNIQQRVRHL